MAVEKRQCAPPPPMERFPVGMRVLAVDDDPICLKMLEALLRKCQYHVTTTNQAIMALKLLRENKDGFDLVISDVHMPDMDGFKLLEHVGLEMDLPVIMLSGNGETSAVMKGITHGACDYLLKPVRIEELKNIWQHVIRRKKLDNRDHDNFDNGYDGEKPQVNSDGGHGSVVSGSLDRNEKLNRKRKDQAEEDDDEDDEENTNENEDPSTHKRPRVVWSIELHGKFVDAVNQLGIEKAVPKRILELMNVEKLTRENVASHLQKYRLYLKRINAVASQQANMVAPLGGRDTSFLPMSSLEGYRNFNALMRTGHVPAPHSFQQRTNYPTGMGLHVLPPGGVHFGHMQNAISNPFNDICKQQCTSLSGNPYGNVLQGLPAPLELDHMQQKREQDANNYMSSGFCGGGLAAASSQNAVVNPPNSSLLLQCNQQQMQARGLGCHTSVNASSLSSNPFEMTVGSSSHLPDLARCNDNWQGINAQCKATSLGRNMMHMPMTTSANDDSKQFNSMHIGNSTMKLEEYRLDDSRKPNLMCSSSMSSSLPSFPVGQLVENQRRQDGLCSLKKEMITVAQSNFDASFLPQFCKVDRSSTDGQMKYRDEFDVDASKFQGGLRSNSGSLDDLVNAMIKPERNDLSFVDGEMGCDIYPISTCM